MTNYAIILGRVINLALLPDNKEFRYMSKRQEEQFLGLVERFKKAVDIATGKSTGKSLFYDFTVNPSIRGNALEALKHFEEGNFNNAEAGMFKALSRLENQQRDYVRESVTDTPEQTSFFTRLIVALPHLDEDIESNILKRKEELIAHVGQNGFDLEKASELSWGLRDAIFRAWFEQPAREANREHKKLVRKVRRRESAEALAVEQAREAQQRHNAEMAENRSRLASDLKKELMLA